ncbi:hypothetical protein D047_4874A, partial [Vibrio parahaemolyticus VPTS-2010_2]
MEGVSRAHRD